MNQDEIRLTFAGLRLFYPPMPRFRQNQLPELFAQLSKTYPLESFEVPTHLPGSRGGE